MNELYKVTKTFAVDSEIIEAGKHMECSPEFAQKYAKNLELIKESKNMDDVNVKAELEAIRKDLKAFAPKVETKKNADYTLGEYMKGIAKKTINTTTSSQGGATTTIETEPAFSDILKSSRLASLVPVINLTGENNVYKFNIVNSIGTAPSVVTEGSAASPSQPTLSSFQVDLEKATYLYYATDEAISDTGALISEINAVLPEEFAKFIENGMINGSGSCFDGWVGDANTVSVAKVSGQTSATINVDNINSMYVAQKNPSESVWVMSRSAYAEIQGLEDSNGNNLFVGTNNFADTPFGTLKGQPIIVSDKAQAVGTVGDISFVNPRKYKLCTKDGLKIKTSEHIKFLEDMMAYRFTYRLGGRPAGLKETATDGTQVAHFVTLATRA